MVQIVQPSSGTSIYDINIKKTLTKPGQSVGGQWEEIGTVDRNQRFLRVIFSNFAGMSGQVIITQNDNNTSIFVERLAMNASNGMAYTAIRMVAVPTTGTATYYSLQIQATSTNPPGGLAGTIAFEGLGVSTATAINDVVNFTPAAGESRAAVTWSSASSQRSISHLGGGANSQNSSIVDTPTIDTEIANKAYVDAVPRAYASALTCGDGFTVPQNVHTNIYNRAAPSALLGQNVLLRVELAMYNTGTGSDRRLWFRTVGGGFVQNQEWYTANTGVPIDGGTKLYSGTEISTQISLSGQPLQIELRSENFSGQVAISSRGGFSHITVIQRTSF